MVQNFRHDYSHHYDPATVPQKKELSALIAARLDLMESPGVQYCYSDHRHLFADSSVITHMLMRRSRQIRDDINLVTRHRKSVGFLHLGTKEKGVKIIEDKTSI